MPTRSPTILGFPPRQYFFLASTKNSHTTTTQSGADSAFSCLFPSRWGRRGTKKRCNNRSSSRARPARPGDDHSLLQQSNQKKKKTNHHFPPSAISRFPVHHLLVVGLFVLPHYGLTLKEAPRPLSRVVSSSSSEEEEAGGREESSRRGESRTCACSGE